MSDYYLGIDGGGTKTEAVILDDRGCLVGQGVAGASNANNIGAARAQAGIRSAVAQAAAEAGAPTHGFTAAFLGIAGVVSQTDREMILRLAQELDLAYPDAITVDHDCRVALAGAFAGEPGIVQIIGTGTSCFGMDEAGNRWLAGGWGRLLGDEGGGYWLGLQAMKAATAAYDGRGEATILQQTVVDTLGLASMEQIMHRLYVQEMTVTDIATLGLLVLDAARQDDPVAESIINTGMEAVARSVTAVANHLDLQGDHLRLACVGGIMHAADVVEAPLRSAVRRHVPDCRFATPRFPAAVGAALLARRQRERLTPEFLATLQASMADRES